MIIKEILEKCGTDYDNVPETILNIDLNESYFDTCKVDNRKYTCTGQNTESFEINGRKAGDTLEYLLVINLKGVKITSVDKINQVVNNNLKVSKDEEKTLLDDFNKLFMKPVVKYTINSDTFNHQETYDCFGGLINHS